MTQLEWQTQSITVELSRGGTNKIDLLRDANRSSIKELVLGLASLTKFIPDLDKNNSIDGLVKKVKVSDK